MHWVFPFAWQLPGWRIWFGKEAMSVSGACLDHLLGLLGFSSYTYYKHAMLAVLFLWGLRKMGQDNINGSNGYVVLIQISFIYVLQIVFFHTFDLCMT